MQVDSAVGLLRDTASHHVTNRQRRMALALHFPQGRQRVGRFSALRDGKQQRVALQRRIPIAKLAGVFHLDRQSRQRLDLIFAHQGRVPTGAAGGHHDAVYLAELPGRQVQPAEVRRRLIHVEPAPHGISDGPRLLEDLLEHVVFVPGAVHFA